MNKIVKIIIVLILILIVGAVIALKETNKPDLEIKIVENLNQLPLPKMVDLGADKCVPCKMMAPILEELKKEYAGIFNVEFIDVWKNPDAGKGYAFRMIPTQIFFDAAGKELSRHEGFFSKKDILSKWKELGISLEKRQE